MGERKNNTFSKSIKEEAIRLMEQSGRQSANQAGRKEKCGSQDLIALTG